jgi:hypothetical protein
LSHAGERGAKDAQTRKEEFAMKRNTLYAAIVFLVLAFVITPAHAGSVANPTVTGPIPVNVPFQNPSHDYPQLATNVDLVSYGYIEQEFFFEGNANYYDMPVDANGIGMTGTVIGSAPYKSRMIVRRPVCPKAFNGVVIVEWFNVTPGYNWDIMWMSTADLLMREGYAYVGVSAQRVGVQGAPAPGALPTGLTYWSPVRYGTLDVTAGGSFTRDELSYDIFSQAVQAVKKPQGVDPLGGLHAKIIIATGVSQSEVYLARYYNSVQPIANVIDGFYLCLGGGDKLRTDIPTKAWKFQTEDDLIAIGAAGSRQDDSDHLRRWEIAGASHVSYELNLARIPLLVRDNLPLPNPSTCVKQPAMSHIPTSHAMKAVYGHLVAWIIKGTRPPKAPLIELTSISPPVVARDELGNALGGLQLSQFAVPLATNTGENSGGGFCYLYGSYTPFDQATLDSLYHNHHSYVEEVVRVDHYNLKKGYIVEIDAIANRETAEQSNIGKYRCSGIW